MQFKIGVVGTSQLSFPGPKEKVYAEIVEQMKKNAKEMSFGLVYWPKQVIVADDARAAVRFMEEEKVDLLREEKIAVQGVIDLFFREKNGNIVLVDYKTDFLTAEELKVSALAEEKLKERHAEQLLYYKKAIEQILGKSPSETLIYSLPLGKTIRI